MNKRQGFGVVGFGVLALGITACEGQLPGKTNGSAPQTEKVSKNVNIGGPLFTPEEVKIAPKPPITAGTQADPIIITGAQLTIPSTENVPTKNNGVVWQICTEIEPGQQVDPKNEFISPTTNKKYRKLREGDRVEAGKLVALLDDKVARGKHKAAQTDLEASEEQLKAAQMVVTQNRATADVYKKEGVASKVEQYKAESDWALSVKQAADAKGARDKNIEALNIAKITLDEHELRASISGEIKTIYVKPGEAVKEQSPVLLIQNLDTLRAEGMMPIQYLPWLPNATGKIAYLEPSAQLSAQQELIGHWAPVTGVAVSKDIRKPLIVSVGEDKFVRVWERNTRAERAHVQTSTALRAVACTGPKSQANLAVFGGDDGQGQILDLDRVGEADAVRKLAATHRGRINTVAFTPDGLHCITADNKEIIVHDATTGAMKYRFNSDHRGPITSVQVTPQAKLISVAQDKTMRVWDLGESGAKLYGVIDNRSGNVDVLGVSPDGQKVLFDQERALHVRGIYDQRTEAVMTAPTDSSQFSTFAVFSPDGSLVVAAGTADNPLGIWKLPTPGSNRAFQRVKLAIGAATATCAAVAPEGGKFMAVGTNDHRVLVFARPEQSDLEKQYQATIKRLEVSIESTERESKVKIWAELPNPGMPLIPGASVNMVIPPQ
jgi:multidrug efflux pump subunit AcrA (membrane-fusion protein)